MRISMCQSGILGTAHGMFKDYVWVGVVSWAVPDNQYWSTLLRVGWHGNPDDRCLGISNSDE